VAWRGAQVDGGFAAIAARALGHASYVQQADTEPLRAVGG
jgi:hypothetical protein